MTDVRNDPVRTDLNVGLAVMDFKPGLYRHYKGGYYVAIQLVAHHDSRMPMVVYASCTHGTVNVRPLIGWSGDEDGWSDDITDEFGIQRKRFEFVVDAADEVP